MSEYYYLCHEGLESSEEAVERINEEMKVATLMGAPTIELHQLYLDAPASHYRLNAHFMKKKRLWGKK